MAGQRPAGRRVNPRKRKIWIAAGSTVGGLVLLTALGIGLERLRETDFADPGAGVTAALDHQIPPHAPALTFREVAAAAGIRMRHAPGPRGRTLPEDTGSGLAWGDYDGDGDFDLYLANFTAPLGAPPRPAGSNRLFRNDGGTFVDVTAEAGVGDPGGFGMGASFADYDGDGDADLHVTNYGPDRLFRNRGDGSFEELAAAAGVDDGGWSVGAAWGDWDGDGHLDLYTPRYVAFDPEAAGAFEAADPEWQGVPVSLNPNAFDPQPNRLYKGLPGGRFEEVALPLGVSDPGGRSLGATFTDLDGDGWLDLYVANDVSPNSLFHNLTGRLGSGAPFEDWSAATGTADPRGSMGISVADLGGPGGDGGDGLPDLFITHWVAQENALYQALIGPGGRLEYRDKARHLRVGEISLDRIGWGSAFTDLDLDGRVDLVLVNGSTLEDGGDPPALVPQVPFLFWNDGDRFYDLAPAAGEALTRPYVARGLAVADYDGDGDTDLAVSVNRGSPLLLRNELPPVARRLGVRLSGPAARTVGSRLTLDAGGPGQVRFWGADASYASGHAPEAHFGLAGVGGQPELAIRWNGGGFQRIRRLPEGRTLVIGVRAPGA